ncbi:MAG: c-type cytochrome, partial [Planctomycetaceae bacterium]
RRSISAEGIAIAVEKGSGHEQVAVRALFARFLPEEKRAKRLGTVVRADEILKLNGDAAQGRRHFFETEGVQCRNCHRVGGAGRAVGPDLDNIAKNNSPAQLLESILEPAKRVDPKFVTYLVETKAGTVHTGLLVKKDADEVVLKDAQDKTTQIPAGEIEHLSGQSTSLMPELLVRDLTAQQLADLIAYLSSLK